MTIVKSSLRFLAVSVATAGALAAAATQAATPLVGWRAELSELFHEVSGTVTIVDADTVRVDDFTYDGRGLVVYFYLGANQSTPAFTNGLAIGPQLVGTPYDGTQDPLLFDLPAGQTIDGYHAVSVWCVNVSASFGDGTFLPTADFTKDGSVDAGDLQRWEDSFALGAGADADLDGLSGGSDFLLWQRQLGEGLPLVAAVPEPATAMLALAAVATGMQFVGRRRRRSAAC